MWLPYKNWIQQTYKILLTHPKTNLLTDPILQHILSYFFWRPSNIPTTFSQEYKKDTYWSGKFSHLKPPKTPAHLVRYQGCDPVPRLQTGTEIVRRLVKGTVPRRRRYWLRHAPNPENWFAKLTGPDSEITIPTGTYQEFTPAGPGPWRNKYLHCKPFKLVPTSNHPYRRVRVRDRDPRIAHIEEVHNWN